MPRGGNNNKDKRHWVVALRTGGFTLHTTAEIAGVSVKFVRTWEKRHRDTGGVERKAGSGRPISKLTPRVKRFISRNLRSTNSSADVKRRLQTRLGVTYSRSMIWRTAKGMGMKPKPRGKQPALSEKNKQDRLEFAQKYINKPVSFWRKWLFTDEKKYYRMSLKRTQWCLKNEEPKKQSTRAVPPQTYVWAGISYRGRTPLHQIKHGLNTAKYKKS